MNFPNNYSYGVEHYEALRQEAMETPLYGQIGFRRGHGLALLITRGMAEWFNALKILVKPAINPESQTTARVQASLPSLIRSDLTLILTNMITTITCCQQEHP